jgi:hypothetical protein
MEEEPSLEKWRSSLQDTGPPTKNMMRWMDKFDELCNKACCFSPQCACIRCTGCGQSLTRADIPQTRYQCMECPVIINAPSSRPELCQFCFDAGNTRALHDHYWFCKVDNHGHHSVVKRSFVVERQELTLQHFHPVVDLSLISNKDCMVCCEPFNNNDKLPVSPAGCLRGHGESKTDPIQGIVDTRLFYCGECALAFEQSRDRGTFCDLTMYCECCTFEREMNEWKIEFRELFNRCRKDPIKKKKMLDDLLELHIQPWIQLVVKEEFEKKN